MDKQALLEKIKNHPNDIEIVAWNVEKGYCSVEHIEEITIEDSKGKIKKAIKLY